MEVILKEDVNKLGQRGDVVKVADGYARNLLLPGKLAIEANAANKAVIEQMKASAVRKSAKEKTESEALSAQLNEVQLVIERKVGENEHLFGSVTSGDIAQQLEQKGFTIDRRKISLEEPLKTIGEYHVPVNADIHDIEVIFVDEPDERINALGVKGLGEIGIVGVAAAVANAVHHATGKRIRKLPITLDKLLG